jgi:SMC interacting uncharacterized protein involved in chromosome segregation
MINEYADKYSKILNDKDPKKADSLENDIISTISKLASDNKIKNILGKNDQAIRDDLFNASIKKLAGYFSSGKSNAFKLLNLEKSKLTDPVSFANAMRAQRKEVESKHSKALKDLQAAVDEKTKRLKLLMAQKELLRKKQQSLLDQLEKPEICKPEKEYVQKEAERINKAIENIENEIKLYDKQIEKLKESKDKQIADQENAYINVVNAKIDILAKLLNQENKSLSRPRDPNFKDKLYGRMKKAAVIAATVGLTGVAAACGYDKYYYDGKYAGSSVDYLKNAYSNYSNIFSSKEDSDMCPAVPFNSIYYNSTL